MQKILFFINNPTVIETIILWAVHVVTYVTLSTMFYVIDVYYYKDERYKNTSKSDIWCIGINLLITLPYILCFVPLYELRGIYREEYYYLITIMRLILTVLMEDIIFYTLHRILHKKELYQHIHKTHHKFQKPVAFTAIYCSGVEHIVANITPVLLAPFIVGLPWDWIKVWVILTTVSILMSHSGYWFGEFHDIHHETFTKNYGVFGLMDKAFSTYQYPRV